MSSFSPLNASAVCLFKLSEWQWDVSDRSEFQKQLMDIDEILIKTKENCDTIFWKYHRH